ncbi:MAG: sigma-54-dependent Fis family transcriptional regulator [Deltaproteobacteria bacterium]|nr:sigma-54-dependent Fis family transcriptional regulator [Deltaproteobacteria bacterium]
MRAGEAGRGSEGVETGRPTILLVEDDATFLEAAVSALGAELGDIVLELAPSLAEALARLEVTPVDAVILDRTLPDGDGLEVVRVLRRRGLEVPFLLLSGDASARAAVEALRAGAQEYLVKTSDALERAAAWLRSVVEMERDDVRTAAAPLLIGRSPAMRAVRDQVRRFAQSSACVRIEGETGVGKELVARSIHQSSARRAAGFVAINCGALPEGLAESELFGHVRGAFTGAQGDRMGLVEHARGGTLLLDEVEDLPLPIQGKLLRFIQEGEYRPVGTPRVQKASVRILAASNRDLGAMVEEGAFRRDLFYRLDVLRIRVPPLRERLVDLPLLLRHAARRRSGSEAENDVGFAPPLPEEIEELRRHPWPGNVRELENVVERARVTAHGSGWRVGWATAIGELASVSGERSGAIEDLARGSDASVPASELALERRALETVLARHRWRRDAAATDLGISRVTLWRRMRRLGMCD